MSKTTAIPKFIEEVKLKDLKEIETLITEVSKKIMNSRNDVFLKKYPKNNEAIIGIASHIRTLIEALLLLHSDNKMNVKKYFTLLNEIITQLDISIKLNSKNFSNKKVLKHYQEILNLLLIEGKVMSIINFCLLALRNGL